MAAPEEIMRIPIPKNPIRKREDGSTEIGGLTLPEYAKATAALASMWALVAIFSAVLFIAAKEIRAGTDVFQRPGDAIGG